MTPQNIIDAARQRYNAVSDTFWTDAELLQHLYEACLELSRESLCIEYAYSTTSTAGTQAYAYPARTLGVKRVTYAGKRVDPIAFREDDRLTFFDSATTAQGQPSYYFEWDESIYLRPIPDTSALAIVMFVFREHDSVTAGSTLEIPSYWQPKTIDYIVSRMSLKEKNYAVSDRYQSLWEVTVEKARLWGRRRKRFGSFATVQDEASYIEVPGVV